MLVFHNHSTDKNCDALQTDSENVLMTNDFIVGYISLKSQRSHNFTDITTNIFDVIENIVNQ